MGGTLSLEAPDCCRPEAHGKRLILLPVLSTTNDADIRKRQQPLPF